MWDSCFTPPSRISAQERECYRRWIKEKQDSDSHQALVLGVTPEIRAELFAFGYQVTCVDMSLDMILAMNELLPEKMAEETLVRGNWLSVPLAKGHFDLVIGDAILPNVPWDDRVRLLSRIHGFLKPGGAFLTRAFCAPTVCRFPTVKEALDAAGNKTALPFMQRSLELVLELQYLTYSPSDHIGSFRKAKEALDQYLQNNPGRRTDEKVAALIEHQYSFWFSRFLEKIFVYSSTVREEAEYRRYFSIDDHFETPDHDYGALTPMYFLRK
ncbi:MAG: class I SAM-dependent methyltransferase [Alphaproteobacteria bacterium]|nr:class I SAM-dependent methyltransferase [Alphaproteobacteria bacterium]